MFSPVFQRVFQPVFDRGLAAVSALVYLFRDEFTTPDDAPLTSPRTCEPGPGTLTFVDTANRMTIGSGRLNLSAGAEAVTITGNTFARAVGLMGSAKVADNTAEQGIDFLFHNRFLLRVAGHQDGVILDDNTAVGILPLNTTGERSVKLITRTAGMWYVDNSTLMWVSVSSSANPYWYARSATNNSAGYWASARVAQLGAPWDTDYGIATERIASAIAGNTITSEANSMIEATWKAITGETYELSTRRTDDDNRWIVRCSQAGGTIKLIERNAGSETERGSATQTWTNGTNYRVIVQQSANYIRTYVE